MPARAGTNIYRLNVRGAGRVARDLEGLSREIQDAIVAELRELGLEAKAIYRGVAPEDDTGQLRENIDSVAFFRAVRPRVRVVVEPIQGHGGDPRSYLDVSRYGHRKRKIRPVKRTALKIHYAGHRNPTIFVFRASAEGVRVPVDWVVEATPAIDRLVDKAESRLGRRIERRIG